MPRYAVIDNGVVVGVLARSTPPTFNVPVGRLFVDVTELLDIQGGEIWDGFMFSPATAPDVAARLSKVESDVAILKLRVP